MTPRFPAARALTDDQEAEIQRRIADDPDNPEITDAQIGQRKSFAEAFPQLADSIKRGRGRPKLENAKLAVTLRLDPETVSSFQTMGEDWRAKMAEELNRAAGRKRTKVP